MSADEKSLIPAEVAERAEWLIALGAFIYTTGFFVSYVYADWLGAAEISIDLFRTKYVLVGILCLALPTVLMVSVLSLNVIYRERKPKRTRRKRRSKKGSVRNDSAEIETLERDAEETAEPMPSGKNRPMYGSSVVLAMNLLLTFYIFLLFAPAGSLRSRPYLVWLIFLATIVGIILIEKVPPLLKNAYVRQWRRLSRWILCIAVLAPLDVFCFFGMRGHLWHILWPRGINSLFFAASLPLLVWRVRLRSAEANTAKERNSLWGIAMVFLALLYVLYVFAFAYTIYPHIPSGRGGGNYSDAPRVLVTYSSDALQTIPEQYRDGNRSRPLVLIGETAEDVILGEGDPAEWSTGSKKPTIVSIQRKALTTITFAPTH